VTSEGTNPSPVANELLELVAGGNRDEAVRLVRSLLLSAADPTWLIEGVLVPLQRRVGELWELSEIEVADVSAVTAIVEELLSAIAFHVERRTDRGRVIVACPRGEWHTLPARMACELLQMHGWSVMFSGASTASATLAAFARSQQPLAVALSCTMAAVLVSAADIIEALHEDHIPVLAGGPAFGPDDRRARAIGADGWTRSITEADRMLASWSHRVPTLKAASAWFSPLLSASDVAHSVDAALRRLDRGAAREGGGRSTGVTGPDLSGILDVLNAGLLTDDSRVVSDAIERYRGTFASRGLPPETMSLVLQALGDTLPPAGRSLLSLAVENPTTPGPTVGAP
jgi:methanogenic corrinoid protein MtbC1